MMLTFKTPIFSVLAMWATVFMAGCASSLPYSYSVKPIIPETLQVEGVGVTKNTINKASAKAYAVNDAGDVVGVYQPLVPEKAQIFVFSSGRLRFYDAPCDGAFFLSALTNTKLIAGSCYIPSQANRGEEANSFLLSYEFPGPLQMVKPAWPTDGYVVTGLNDRGDAIGYYFQAVYPDYRHKTPPEFVGFVYVGGQLRRFRLSEVSHSAFFLGAKLSAAGEVVGAGKSSVPDLKTERLIPQRHWIFRDGKFVALPEGTQGSVVAVNRSGQWLTHVGAAFGINDGQFRLVGCEKESCHVYDFNDRGWVLGERYNSYAIPPLGATWGEHFLWVNGQFFSLDQSIHRRIKAGYPIRLSNAGHILLHVDGWPYLLSPTGDSPAKL